MAFDYSQRVFFLGCFCECHNSHEPFKKYDQMTNASGFTMPAGSKDVVSHKRQCDSVLSRIIYSFKMFDQFFGPFHH
jgi:hypothetical protein